MMRAFFVISLLLLELAGAAALSADQPDQLPIGDPERRERQAPVTLDALTDTRTGDVLTPSQLPERLKSTRLLLVGESHTSDEFHRVQEMVLRELQHTGRKVVVGLEMMPTDQQPALDRWVAGELSEDAFLEAADWYENWGYNWEYYRPIFQLARRHGLTLRGLNVPRELVREVREKGFEQLEEADRQRLPPEIQAPDEPYSRLFLSYFDQESSMHGLEGEMLEGFLRAQTAWDASMAWSAVQILRADPEAMVVVLIGSGHVAYGLGVARQAAPWLEAPVKTLIPVPVEDEGAPVSSVTASYADFVWGVAEERWPRFPSLGLSTRAGEEGARQVLFVEDDSAAAVAGVEAGDLLISIDGHAVDGAAVVRRVMGSKLWGDTVELRWRRGDEEKSATAVLRRDPS